MKRVIFFLFTIMVLINPLYGKEMKKYKYNKIISMSTAGDEILFDMVDKNRILAFSGRADGNVMTSILNQKLATYKKVNDNVEKVIELEPDLVIVPSWLKKDIVSQLEEAGINIYIYKNPFTYEEVKHLIRELALLLEEKEKGEQIIKNMDKRLLELQKRIKKMGKPSPRILEYSHYEGTNGEGSIFDDMVKKIYGINVAKEMGMGRYSKISKEAVINENPDIILVPIWDSTPTKDSSKFLKFIKTDKSFKDMKAVKENKVYSFPGKYIYVYSHHIIDGIEELAKEVYQLK